MQAGTSVLITGGTGSFGQAFVERLLKDGLATRICIYSRGEHAQSAMANRFRDGSGRCRFFIGDVRDRWRLTRAMDGCDIVVHAAALKRIEVGFYNPEEMVKTNVEGAMNVIAAAREAKVKKVVALSTDKACQPISPYGYSKALAESLFLSADHSAGRSGPRFEVTRWGNIWRSAGSVVPTWEQQLEDGAEVIRITDPECTRFYMRMDEGIDLTLEAINAPGGGIIRIPKTLRAYELGQIPRIMGARTVTIGLPDWEKKHESMMPGVTSDKARQMSDEEIRAEWR